MSSTSSKLVKLDFQPGIRRESTQYAETNSWYDANNVRFRAGKPENIGGYVTKVSATFNGAEPLIPPCQIMSPTYPEAPTKG